LGTVTVNPSPLTFAGATFNSSENGGGLQGVTISSPSSNTKVFRGLCNLGYITFDDAECIAHHAFQGVQTGNNALYVTAPHVAKIGEAAFKNSAIREVSIGNQDEWLVGEISAEAFAGCISMTDLYILFDAVMPLSNANAFDNYGSGKKIHVP